MASQHECPACDAEFGSEGLLVMHVARLHMEHRVHPDTDRAMCLCWCGTGWWEVINDLASETIGAHLKASGGVHAHYLACALGVPDEPA